MALHDGHRQRMYGKVAKEGLLEHEWLEVLLYAAIPRRNTNDIAHRLIQRFGSVMAVLEASMEELQAVTGIGKSAAAHLKCIYHFYKEYHNHAVRAYDGRFDSRSFLPYGYSFPIPCRWQSQAHRCPCKGRGYYSLLPPRQPPSSPFPPFPDGESTPFHPP